jgi:hypothetical protein
MPLSRVRLLTIALTCAGLVAGSATAEVIPGRNVNMVSGTSWPDGDPFLQRQNEGSIAVSTRNPLHLLAGGNDYRTVDIPGLPDGRMTGDAWQGVYWSRDGGHKWESSLIPGYLQDNSAEGLASPLKGLEAGADAVVRAGTNGLMYYAGIAFNRAAIPDNAHGTGAVGKVFVTRFIDDNAKETGNPFRNLGTAIADHGDETRFLDKPWLAVDVPRSGASQCTIPGTGPVPAQTFKAGNVYLTYTAVSGDPANLKTRLLFTRSRDCGATWSIPTRLTDGTKVDQGTVIAIHPLTGWVYVAWRRIDPVQRTATFLLTISIDGGRNFTRPIQIAHLPAFTLSDGTTNVASVFEQGTSLVSFRTTGFPALTVDALGIVYVAWSERGRGPEGDARIVVKRSPGGLFWWWPAETANDSRARGHELMPSLLYHGGKILLVHYNLVEDHTTGLFTPNGDGTFTEVRVPAGDLAPPSPTPANVYGDFVADFAPAPAVLKRRHTMELWVRAAEPTLCDFDLEFTSSTRVSQYAFGDTGGPDAGTIRQLQYNPPNLPMFSCQGNIANCKAFIGDYVDVAGGPAFVPKGSGWMYNLDRRRASTAHAIWTDNRDVRPPPAGKMCPSQNPEDPTEPPEHPCTWADYTPPNSPFSATLPPNSLFDPSKPRPVCRPETAVDGFTTAGMRNQNLYTSRITEGLVAISPQNAKQLGFGVLPGGETVLLQRSFVVAVQNTTNQLRTFRVSIRNQPPDPPTGKASFLQFADPAFPDPLTELFLNVGARSSATRTVFVTSTNPDASITVDVQEATQPGGDVIPPDAGGLEAMVVLNADITNPDIANPDIANPDIANPDIANAEVYNPDIANPDIANPDIANPDIANPDIANPDIANPDIANPDIANVQVYNPDIANPDIANPDIANPDIANPDIANPDIANGSLGEYTDGTWTITNQGNTTAGYDVKLLSDPLPPGFQAQLLIHRGHSTPLAVGCDLAVQRQTILVANIPNPIFLDPLSPDFANSDATNPDLTNATFSVGPGTDWVQVTLRLFDAIPGDAVTGRDVLNGVTPVIVAQGVNTIEAARGSRTPPVAVPTSTLVVFTQPPSRGSAGVPLSPPVAVQVRNNTGAVVPGALVTLSLAKNPSDANLDGNTATTDAVGRATFPNLTVDRAGAGYTLRASAGELDPAFSAPFTILEACAPDGAPSVTSYSVEGPGINSRPVASREAADFDGDGDRDLAVIHGDGTITKMAGNGLGAFERAFQFRIGTTKTPRALAVGDFNEDGLSDVVVAYTDSSQLGLALSDRNATVQFFTATPTVIALAGGPSAVGAGDVNGDGNLDVVAALESADQIAVLLGDGAGGFGDPTRFPAGNAPLALALGRFHSDGALDVAVVHYPDDDVFLAGRVSVLAGDGLGGFSVASTTPTGSNPTSIAAADLDKDGTLDVAVANGGGNDVTVLYGDGVGGFGSPLTIPLGVSPLSVAAGDFDGDGNLDLATANGAANNFSLLFSNGDGGYKAPAHFTAGLEPVDISAGDFNADGRPDLVVTNRLNNGDCCDNVSIVMAACGATTADLSVALSDAPDPVAEGGAITYTARVSNKGPFTATGVELRQEVPGAVQAASPSSGDCTLGPPVVCNLGDLASGQASTVTVVVTAPAGVSGVVSRATASANELDRLPSDNSASAATGIASGPRSFVVTNTDDSGPGSLRQAMLDANRNAGFRDTITFAIPGPPPHTIMPASALPAITDPVLIDAPPTGECAGDPPTIELDGIEAGEVPGLIVTAGNTTIRGLAITGFDASGIFLDGSGNNVVECSYLGVRPDGERAPNNDGLFIRGSSSNTIGGTSPALRNVISGNLDSGVNIQPETATGNAILGNYIGTNATGSAPLGNGRGIAISEAPANVIGGTAAGSGNVISGNTSVGVQILGAQSTGNVVAGNLIGTDTTGTRAVPNGNGIEIIEASRNTVGGDGGATNTISGNTTYGIWISGATAQGNIVLRNRIGTNVAGRAALGNGADGVAVDLASGNTIGGDALGAGNIVGANGGNGVRISGASATGNLVRANFIGTDGIGGVLGNALAGVSLEFGAAENTIGGALPGLTRLNHIAFNGESGVRVASGAGSRNSLQLNQFRSNGGLAIDLGGDGVTSNDEGDPDIGPNDLQNAPVVTGASTTVTGGVRIQGTLNSVASTGFTIEFFLGDACDPSGRGEGERWIGSLSDISTNSDGNLSFVLLFDGTPVSAGQVITALATSAEGNTSEFSNCSTVISGTPPDGFTKVWVGGSPADPASWFEAGNWSPAGVPTSGDDTYVSAAPHQPSLGASSGFTRRLTVAAGSNLDLGISTLEATGDVDVSGTMSASATGILRMAPPAPASLRGGVPNLEVAGPVDAGGPVSVAGRVVVVSGGDFSPGSQTVVVEASFQTEGSGVLRMSAPSALLEVGTAAAFNGGSTEGTMTGGTLRVGGDLTQSGKNSPSAFAPSAGHLTILDNPRGIVHFTDPGSGRGTSHFGTLQIDADGTRGDVVLTSQVHATGQLVTTGAVRPALLGSGHAVQVAGLNVFALSLSGTPLVSTSGVITRFDDVTFGPLEGAPPYTPLTIIHGGEEVPFVFKNLNFALPSSPLLLVEGPALLRINLTGALPDDGCPFVAVNGEALVNWNGRDCLR